MVKQIRRPLCSLKEKLSAVKIGIKNIFLKDDHIFSKADTKYIEEVGIGLIRKEEELCVCLKFKGPRLQVDSTPSRVQRQVLWQVHIRCDNQRTEAAARTIAEIPASATPEDSSSMTSSSGST